MSKCTSVCLSNGASIRSRSTHYISRSVRIVFMLETSTVFHEQFDSVIENCITRKNQGIKRIESPIRKKEVIETAYKTVVKRTRERHDDSSVEPVRMFHSWTIKDLRKTFSTLSKTHRQSDQ